MKLELFLYLKKNKIKSSKFCEDIGCSRECLSRMIHGHVKVSNMLACAIEKATKGQVTAEYMKGDNVFFDKVEMSISESNEPKDKDVMIDESIKFEKLLNEFKENVRYLGS